MSMSYIPLVNEPKIVKDYFSWIQNQPAALTPYALIKTVAAVKSAFGARINRPSGPKDVTQLIFVKGNETREYKSHDLPFLKFQKDLADELSDIEPSKQLTLGVSGEGIVRPFDTMYTHGARPMDPWLSPRVDKLGKAASELPGDYMLVLSLISEIYFDKFEATNVRINGKSKSGIPHNTNDAAEKKRLFMEVLDHGKGWSSSIAMGDYDYSAKHFGSAPITTPTIRDQVEPASKVRGGFDYLGNVVEAANKKISPNDAHGMDCFNALRRRTAYAVPFAVSAPIQAFIAGFRSQALEIYGETWHERYSEDIIKRIYKYGFYRLFDASAFDTTFDWKEITTIIDSIPSATDLAKDYLRRIHRLPLLISSDQLGVAGAYLLNTDQYSPGLQSGVPTVSDFGKIRGTAHWIYGLVKLGALKHQSRGQLKEDIKTVLLHKHPIFAMQNRGDDTMPLATRQRDLDAWCDIVSKLPFAQWKEDFTKKFIGRVLYQGNPGSRLVAYGDINTMLERSFINERSMLSKHRPFAASGNLLRYDTNMGHPGFNRVMDIVDTNMIRHFGMSYREAYQSVLPMEKRLTADLVLPEFSGLNEATRAFMIDPDVIYKGYREQDIDPRILEAFYPTSIDPDLCEQAIDTFGFMK